MDEKLLIFILHIILITLYQSKKKNNERPIIISDDRRRRMQLSSVRLDKIAIQRLDLLSIDFIERIQCEIR